MNKRDYDVGRDSVEMALYIVAITSQLLSSLYFLLVTRLKCALTT